MTRFQDPRHPRLAGLPIEAESLENSLAVESLDHADFRGPTPEIRLRSARYRLLREVGRGVSSRVYQALDRKLGRIVAFKRLDRSSSSGLRLLMREVLGAGRLSHPNIVTLYSVEEADGTHFCRWRRRHVE